MSNAIEKEFVDRLRDNCAAGERGGALGIERDVTEQLMRDKERASLAQAQTPKREKYWSELSIEQKIERCREQVKQQDYRMQELHFELTVAEQRIRSLTRQLHEHGHEGMPAGQVMLPANLREDEMLDRVPYQEKSRVRDADPSQVYF